MADPSKLRSGSLERNFDWMRTVSPAEAKASLERMQIWAKSKKSPSGGHLGEWVFKPISAPDRTSRMPTKVPTFVTAKTENCVQRRWRIPSEFPCCPQEHETAPITTYATRLKTGAIFARNELTESVVVAVAIAKDCNSLWVMCECIKNAIKPWALAHVTFEEGLYVHTSLGTFFDRLGAEKQFCLAQGLEWIGGDSIDDYS